MDINGSILTSIKKSLDIDEDYDAFDDVIAMHINTQFSVLFSIGASGPVPFMILGKDETWADYFGDITQAMMVKSYIYLRVKLIFDPPATSFAQQAFESQAKELEWRLGIMEFVFNPDSKPLDNSESEKRRLLELVRRIEDTEENLEELDDEIEEVPDLTAIFKVGLGDS